MLTKDDITPEIIKTKQLVISIIEKSLKDLSKNNVGIGVLAEIDFFQSVFSDSIICVMKNILKRYDFDYESNPGLLKSCYSSFMKEFNKIANIDSAVHEVISEIFYKKSISDNLH